MSRNARSIIPAAILFVAIFSLALSSVSAQQPLHGAAEERERGIQLIAQNDLIGAVKALLIATRKDKQDVVAWYWLGVAFERQGKPGDARKAHEKAAKLGDELIVRQFDFRSATDFKATLAKIRPELAQSAESAKAYLRLNPKLSASKADEWYNRAELLQDYVEFPMIEGFPIYKGSEVSTKARVLQKPEPTYTQAARENQVTGTVVLRGIFAGDGKVRLLHPLAGLPHGLTGNAMKAARQIKFIPATKDGRPVSMWVEIQYNFHLF